METFIQDLRYGLRMLAKSPGFTAVAVLTLGLGIGANTAIFSLLDQVMLRLLPVYKPEQLVVLRSPGPHHGHTWSDIDEDQSFPFPMYKGLREGNTVFSGLLACFPISVSLSFHGQTDRAGAELVSGNFFDVLGVQPALGRLFSLEDDRVPGGHPVVVLSYGYWAQHFGGDPSVLNQVVLVNAHPMTVVGVARRGFTGVQPGKTPDLYVPMMMKAQMTPNWNGLDDWNDYWLAILGRLKPGESVASTEAGIDVTYRALLEQTASLGHSGRNAEERREFLAKKIILDAGGQGRKVLQHDAGTPIVALFCMVALVLLIACTNLASLQVARGAARRREVSIRMALGATRWRMSRQLLLESLLCGLAGGVVALLVAWWMVRALVATISAGTSIEGLSSGLDLRVLGFSLLLTLLAVVLFGLAPSLRATRTDVNSALKDEGPAVSAGASPVRFRKALVAAQAALTLLLLSGAGLFTRTLWNLRHAELGMRPDHLVAFSVAPALSGYDPVRAKALCDQLRADLASLPGVAAASAAEIGSFTNTDESRNITVPGAPPLPQDETNVYQNWVGPGYFSTLGIPLLAGREFTSADGADAPKVAIINQAMAKRFFVGRDPIGTRFGLGAGNIPIDIEIVGVVKDAKESGVREKPWPYVFFPYAQDPKLGKMTFYARAARSEKALAPLLRKTVQELDPNLPVFDLKTVDMVINENLFAERLVAKLAACFGVVAALLAAIGIYGVLAYVVLQRTREIGIRMALGAGKRDVLRLVLRQGMAVTVAGLAVGVVGALALSRYLSSLLYEVRSSDPLTLLIASLGLLGVALLASYIPARRAAKVDPMVALRYE